MRELIVNFSWRAIVDLPPSEFLALLILTGLAGALLLAAFFAVLHLFGVR